MESTLSCTTCGGRLRGRQRRFCSRLCKNADTNNRHQSYANQQARGIRRKMELIGEAGGVLHPLRIPENVAALTWHHVEPSGKRFNLDVRALSNRSEADIRLELAKCILLCANCHAEEHFPSLALSD